MEKLRDNIWAQQGNCLELMKQIPDGKIDFILTDPPYGTTACKWDTVIPFEPMWEQLNRIIKPNGAIVLFGSEPFSSALRMSNIKNYKYDWYLEKENISNYLNAKKQPMRKIEVAMVFNSKVYNPQGLKPLNKIKRRGSGSKTNGHHNLENFQEFTNYPNNLIPFKRELGLHPTQKPIELLEYLVKTYTNESELVLDFTAGSFSTGIACLNTNRKFIGFELDDKYYNIGKERLINHVINNESKLEIF